MKMISWGLCGAILSGNVIPVGDSGTHIIISERKELEPIILTTYCNWWCHKTTELKIYSFNIT